MKPYISSDQSNVVQIDGVLDQDQCNFLIDYFKRSPTQRSIPNSRVRRGTFDQTWEPHWEGSLKSVIKPAMNDAIYLWMGTLHPSCRKKAWVNFGWYISKYGVGDQCFPHTDGILMNEEHNKTYVALAGVSVSLGSSGGTDGALLFPKQDLTVPYILGKATFFPTSYTHPHEVKPLASERYVLLGWLYYECEPFQEGASHLAPGSVFVRYPYDED